MAWAIKWRSNCRLDGKREHLLGRATGTVPPCMQGYHTMAFETREQARIFIEEHYGYIRNRPDLHREPHGWKMPIPVKVIVNITESG